MDKRRQLPLPDGIAPSRRAPPALPVNDDAPPPPVPSRPTPGRPSPSAPAVPTSSRPVPRPPVPSQKEVPQDVYEAVDEPQEEYADCDFEQSPSAQVPDENYDEFEGVAEDDAQEVYDDMEVENIPDEDSPPPSSAPALPPPRPKSQETYDEFEGVGQDTYEIEEKQEEYQECDVAPPDTEEVYEITDADSPSPPPPPSSAPALPPPRPKHITEEIAAPPPPRTTAHKPLAPKGGAGTPAIAIGDIQNIKNRLKKVSVPKPEPEQKEPKVYTDSNELKAKFNFFKQKEQEALLAKGNKPDISPKPASLIRKSVPVKEDKTDSPALSIRPDDKSITSHRDVSDSLPPLPSPVNEDLPPLPPPLSEIPAHNRDLPPPPPPPTNPAMPQDLPPRGKDEYTKVNVREEQNNNDDDQDIYDDALSFEDPLLREKWYFGEIDRVIGSEKLKKFNRNGAYLLRKSTKGGDKQPYTLMVIFKNHVYNLKIRERNDKRVALGEEKPDEMSFKSVTDLIKHHQTNDVILVHKDGKQDTTLLEVSPPK